MEFIDLSINGRLATVTINRPKVRNALHPAALFEISEALDRVEQDDDIWVCVLTGAGEKAFSAGRDLKRLAETSRDESARLADEKLLAASTRLTDRFYFAKPIIARLNGSAYGGGLELALACDIIVAVDHARVGLPEPKRGLIAMAGGVHRLARQIPLKPAMAYLLTGRDMSAATGKELGLINDVVHKADLDSVVQSYVDDILACAPLAVRATKECVMRGLGYPLAEAATREYEWERKRLASEDANEGPRAFAEKRTPEWKGN
jgi:enoyl-CoA hydratase/carnithine racemase